MPVDISTVLVCDAVDQSCIDLLKSNGIAVDYKLKLPKEDLLREVKVENNNANCRRALPALTQITASQ